MEYGQQLKVGQPVLVRHVTGMNSLGINSFHLESGYTFLRWESETGCAMLLITYGHLEGCGVRYNASAVIA